MSKDILDACCGGRMFYFDKSDPRVLFQDIRKAETTLCDGRTFKISPDVVGDFCKMPYADQSFSLVIFDPPHLIKGDGVKNTGWQFFKYGFLPSENWRETLKKGFAECFRVLRDGGFLIFKWCEVDIKVSEILSLTTEKPIIGHKSGKQSKTHWILFQKSMPNA